MKALNGSLLAAFAPPPPPKLSELKGSTGLLDCAGGWLGAPKPVDGVAEGVGFGFGAGAWKAGFESLLSRLSSANGSAPDEGPALKPEPKSKLFLGGCDGAADGCDGVVLPIDGKPRSSSAPAHPDEDAYFAG